MKYLESVDKSNMYKVLCEFHSQLSDALFIAEQNNLEDFNIGGISNIIVTGLGGSAIGGDYVRSYLGYELKIPMSVNRNYCLPAYANENTLLIVSSYSGETEETISAMNDGIQRGCRIICITTGGTIGALAKKNNFPVYNLPAGYQPRCAFAYSFLIVLKILIHLKMASDRNAEISAAIELIKELTPVYQNPEDESNAAYSIARSLKDNLPVIYSSTDILDTVNLRWRGQISENAKVLSYGNLYPEMNHNELVGWTLNKELLGKVCVIFLKDEKDHERTLMRMDITKQIYEELADSVITLNGIGKSRIERMLELTHLGDWVSYWLAISNQVDPTPVDKISFLKKELSKK